MKIPMIAALMLAAPALAEGTALDLHVGGRVAAKTVENNSAGLLSQLFGADESTEYVYSWPGVYFEADFTGDAVDVKLNDDRNDLYLYVDGTHKLTLTRPGRTTVTLKGLGPGRHRVRLEKITETQGASGAFAGFFVASSARALPAPTYPRAIEFIGDSFTVGYGNVSRGRNCTTEDVAETTNTTRAFAPQVAKRLKAAYRIIASSGHGMVRNYDNFDYGKTMPYLYGFALDDEKTPAADAGWNPDAIVIYLGTNDFSTPLKPDEPWKTRDDLRADFVKSYIGFLRTLREKHPGAHLMLMGTVSKDPEMMDAILAVGSGLMAQGFENFEVVPVQGLDFQSCHGHPSLPDEAILSQLLTERLALLPPFADAD